MKLESSLQVFNQSSVPTSLGVIEGITLRKLTGTPEHPSERINVALAILAAGTHEHLHFHLIETFHYVVAGRAVGEAMRLFRGRPQELKLPTAPIPALNVMSEINRPQPRLDVDLGQGMTVSIDRVRACPVLTVKYVALGHNTIRGAAVIHSARKNRQTPGREG